ncbi:MAG TPA: STAS domain-containing protein [Isosphaeraceae bacterium]|nr:STAS domain-containing protein [Isosphaeraceae bacterium]
MTAPSRLIVGRTNSGYCLRVEGRGTMRESPAAHEFGREILDSEGGSLVVALEACDYLDSTFLGCLVDLHRRYGKQEPPRFLVAASPEQCRRLFAPNHLDKLLKATEVGPEVIGEEFVLPPLAKGSDELGLHVMECHRRLAELGGPNQAAFARIADQLARELVNR